MRLFICGLGLLAALAMSTVPSFAQFSTPEQEKADKAATDQVDQQYNSALNKTRKDKAVGEAKVDPWSNMRGTEAPKPKR
jgi:hypothetical protein